MPATTTSASSALPPRFVAHPFLQKATVRQLPPIDDLGLDLRLFRVEAEQRRHRGYHVRHAQAVRHDVRRVELDRAVSHAALGLSHARLDDFLQQRSDHAARGAPGGRPQRDQGRSRRRGQEEVGTEIFGSADATKVSKRSGLERLLFSKTFREFPILSTLHLRRIYLVTSTKPPGRREGPSRRCRG